MASLYEQLMAAKGAPRAAPAPNSSQMRAAPANLRSAMRRYADGGGVTQPVPTPMYLSPPEPQVTAADINSFVQANLGNPQAIADAARQYGVSADDLANATGYSGQQINDYFGNAGLSPFAPQVNPIPPQKPYYDEPIYEPGVPDYTMPVFPKYDDPRMPKIAPDTREADELDRDEKSRKRQREEEAYFFKMLNERRAREEQSKANARNNPYSMQKSPQINQIDKFQKLLEILGRTYK